MQDSPFLNPTFVLGAVSLMIGFIAWLTRLEAKVKDLEKKADKNDSDGRELWTELDHHRSNGDIHFNQRVAAEVDKGNERRFKTIEEQLGEINRKLDRMAP